MKIAYSKRFQKQYHKASSRVQEAIKTRIALFQKNPYDPILNNHVLQGEYQGLRSINITGDWRALYFEKHEHIAYFEYLGTHSQLY